MAKLSADTAALVAAHLTQAHMAVAGGIYAGRKPGSPVSFRGESVESTYRRYLEYVSQDDAAEIKSAWATDD